MAPHPVSSAGRRFNQKLLKGDSEDNTECPHMRDFFQTGVRVMDDSSAIIYDEVVFLNKSKDDFLNIEVYSNGIVSFQIYNWTNAQNSTVLFNFEHIKNLHHVLGRSFYDAMTKKDPDFFASVNAASGDATNILISVKSNKELRLTARYEGSEMAHAYLKVKHVEELSKVLKAVIAVLEVKNATR